MTVGEPSFNIAIVVNAKTRESEVVMPKRKVKPKKEDEDVIKPGDIKPQQETVDKAEEVKPTNTKPVQPGQVVEVS